MAYFLKNGSSYRVATEESLDIHHQLPPGNFIVKADQFGNLFLEHIDSFKPLDRYYGDTLRNTDRILRTFADREASTGVMLTGEKGSGKTLLAKNLCIEGAKQGMPTIVINNSWHGDAFNKLIQDIEQPCVILFDEFEKVYDSQEQESILTLLDGVFPSKKLFVLTCNDKWRIDRHMRNRPGRIFYMLDFKGLTAEFISEYCNENLNEKKYIAQICKIAALFTEFNFDMLKALVEDMNRYGESPQEAMEMLNAKPEYDNDNGGGKFKVDLVVDKKPIKESNLYDKTWKSNPLSHRVITIEYELEEDSDNDDYRTAEFEPTDLRNINGDTGEFMYINSRGDQLKLTRERAQNFDYWKAF